MKRIVVFKLVEYNEVFQVFIIFNLEEIYVRIIVVYGYFKEI